MHECLFGDARKSKNRIGGLAARLTKLPRWTEADSQLSHHLNHILLSNCKVAVMSAPSLANYITKRPWLKRWMMPLANWYADAAGYRKLGLR